MPTSRRELLQGIGAATLVAEFGAIRSRAWASTSAGAVDAGAYSLASDLSYLNHASIGTIPSVVQRAHAGYLELCETNPWLYMWSEPWWEPLERVRAQGAELLGCMPEELAITHNTTEVFNLLATGLPLGRGDEVLFSSLNHPGASVCWTHHGGQRGYTVRQFEHPLEAIHAMTAADVVAWYEREIRPETAVLVVPHVDNQVGLRHPIAAIAAMARERGVRWIAVDGAQTASMLPFDLGTMGVDVFATSCHKWIQSPKGLGLAYVRRERQAELRPMWVTWGQKLWPDEARRFEDYGTRALPGVMALGDALTFQASVSAGERVDRLRALRTRLFELVEADERLIWRSPMEFESGASLVAVEVRGRKASEVAKRLFERHRIVVRAFEQPGLNALRVSPNLANGAADLERFVAAAAG